MPKQYQRKPQSKSREQILKEIEEKARLDRGGFSTFAESTNAPFRVRGRKGQEPFARKRASAPEPFAPAKPQAPQQPVGPQQPGQINNSASDFLRKFTETILTVNEQSSPEQLEFVYQTTGREYPVASSADGGIIMNTGRTVSSSEAKAYPIASMADQGVLYSDDSVRYLPNGYMEILSGLEGLQQGLFGGDQRVTSEFGPREGFGLSGQHTGTDVVLNAKDLYFPVSARVAFIIEDDGTQWGDVSGHQGYGNSIILELSTGERLRFSHLANLGEFQVGDSITPGSYIGTEGNTGNSYGEHLDIEYFAPGAEQPSDPSGFTGFTTPQTLFSAEPIIINPPSEPLYTQQPQTTQTPEEPAQPQQQTPLIAQAGADVIDKLNPTGQFDVGATELLRGQPQEAGQKLAGTIDRANPTGSFDPGVTEALQGDPSKLQGNIAELFQVVLSKILLLKINFRLELELGNYSQADLVCFQDQHLAI